MNEDSTKRLRVLKSLDRAIDDWKRRGNEQPLTLWLNRELDPRGVPIHLPISDWSDCLARIHEGASTARAWPSRLTEPITRLIQARQWFARKDGRPVLEFDRARPRGSANGTRPAEAIMERSMGKTAGAQGDGAPTDWAGSRRVLAVLRPGWPADDEFLAIDHDDLDSSCRFELFATGRSWLGPRWQIDVDHAATAAPRPKTWVSASSGTLAEWSYQAGEARITQSALLLAQHSLALLSALVEYRSPRRSTSGMQISPGPGVAAGPIENCRGIALTPTNNRRSALVLPIGLPSLPYATERGAFKSNDDSLVLEQESTGRRLWLPLLVSWHARRHRRDVHWRTLSVSEKSRNVGADRAVAVRVSWGKDETFIIYRSLANPAPRAFLGHQTTARFLVGRFNRDGVVEPILSVG